MRIVVQEMCTTDGNLNEMSLRAAEQLFCIVGVCLLCFILYFILCLFEKLCAALFTKKDANKK